MVSYNGTKVLNIFAISNKKNIFLFSVYSTKVKIDNLFLILDDF